MPKKIIVKIVFIVILFSLILFIFLLINGLSIKKNVLMPLFVERTKAIAYSMEANIVSEQEIQDKDRLISTIQKNIWLNPDIINVSINKLEDGRLLSYVSSRQSLAVEISDAGNLEAITRDMIVSRSEQIGDSQILSAITPIHIYGKIIGTIQIDFDLDNINDQISGALRREIIYYGVLIILLIIVLIMVFRLVVVRPILEINKGVQALIASDFDYQVKVRSNDEIGNLARSFNQMTGKLKEYRDKLNQREEILKKEVSEKTRSLEKSKDELKNINFDLEKKIKDRTASLEELRINQERMIVQRTQELSQKIAELEKMNNIMINRELKMVELKSEIARLKGEGKS